MHHSLYKYALPFSRLVFLRVAGWTGPFIVGGLLALLLSATWAGSSPTKLTPRDVQLLIPADRIYGSLPPNRGLTITVQVPEQPTLRAETLVAIFEGEGLSQYAVPLEHVPDTNRLSATVDLGRLSSTIGSPLKATLLHVVLARQQGLHTEELVRKSVVVTIATPGYADRSVRTETTTGAVRTRDLFGAEESAEAGIPLLDGGLQEENLLGNAAPEKQDGYWKLLRLLLHHRLRDEFDAPRPGVVRRMPGIHFRLYANGEAQLIEVERSSGNAQVDQAALMSVVNAHPFPPFPAGSSESPVDVHIDLPVVSP